MIPTSGDLLSHAITHGDLEQFTPVFDHKVSVDQAIRSFWAGVDELARLRVCEDTREYVMECEPQIAAAASRMMWLLSELKETRLASAKGPANQNCRAQLAPRLDGNREFDDRCLSLLFGGKRCVERCGDPRDCSAERVR